MSFQVSSEERELTTECNYLLVAIGVYEWLSSIRLVIRVLDVARG